MIKDESKINRPIVWLILLDCLILVGIIVFTFLSYSKMNNSFGDSRGNNAKAESEDLREVKKIVSIQKENQALIGASLVEGSSAVQLIQAIEDVGKKSGVELKINQAENKGKVVAIRIKMAGDFSKIFKALKLLENLPFAIDFNKVAMQKNTTGALATEKVLPWSADIDFSAKTGKK